ncbi:MAG: DUF4149 domain-containing protein [Gemmatimonadaceae bacterium]|nr:DUF4149 domain-containing protein [Gemmatimonadaceae bacterium]
MSTAIAAVVAGRRREALDAADPPGAAQRDHQRALVALVLNAIWGGAGLIVTTTVAPAAFRVLPTRSLAGALVGQVLPVLFIAGIVVGTATVVLTTRRAQFVALRRLAGAGTLLGCAVAQAVIGPRIAALRERIGPSIEALATTDPLRMEFGRLHGFSVLALGVGMVFALVSLIATFAVVRRAPARH